MTKERAISLKKQAEEAGRIFSGERQFNYTNETFEIDEIIPTSETTASVTYLKNTGKRTVFFFYWIKSSGGTWRYFVPTYDHCAGMKRVIEELHGVEITNFGLNFKND